MFMDLIATGASADDDRIHNNDWNDYFIHGVKMMQYNVSTVTSFDDHSDPGRPTDTGNPPGVLIHWLFLPLAVVPVWILGGNFLVLTAVLRQRSLQTLSNWVIASLALTDFLLALIVVPLGVYQLVAGQWNLGLYVCLIWTGSDVVLSTTSIMHLCAIALYRYNGIAHPLLVRSTQDARHVIALVAPAWTIAVALSIPFAVQGILDSSHVLVRQTSFSPPLPLHLTSSPPQFLPYEADTESNAYFPEVDILPDEINVGYSCGLFNRSFAVYSSLVSFFIPLAVMVFADIRSIQILRNNINRLPRANGHDATCSEVSACAPTDAGSTVVDGGVSAGRSRSAAAGRRWRSRHHGTECGGPTEELFMSSRGPADSVTCEQSELARGNGGGGSGSIALTSAGSSTCSRAHFDSSGVSPPDSYVSLTSRRPVTSQHTPDTSLVSVSPCRSSAGFEGTPRVPGPSTAAHQRPSLLHPPTGCSEHVSSFEVVSTSEHIRMGDHHRHSGAGGRAGCRRSQSHRDEDDGGEADGEGEEAETCLQSPSASSEHRLTPLTPRTAGHFPRREAAPSSSAGCRQTYVQHGGRSRSRSVIYISMLASGGRSVKVNSRERRAERTLIWVFVAFVVLWLPFFCTNLAYGLCEHCNIPSDIFITFTWLGYLSSGVNPCIYTYLNRDFRTAFRHILTCRRIVRSPRIPRQYS